MTDDPAANGKGRVAAIVAIVFTLLAVASWTSTAYVSGLWTAAAMAWVSSFVIGGLVTMVLFVVGMIGAGFAIGETRTRRVGVAAIVLAILGLAGGTYGGCRKGWHDLECHRSAPDPAKRCSEFW